MEANKTFIIRHKETKEMFQARSGKTSWKAPGHAKNAFNQTLWLGNLNAYGLSSIDSPSRYNPEGKRCPKFDEQDIFEIVELQPKAVDRLEKAIQLLTICLGRCDYEVHNQIEKFLEDVK